MPEAEALGAEPLLGALEVPAVWTKANAWVCCTQLHTGSPAPGGVALPSLHAPALTAALLNPAQPKAVPPSSLLPAG